MARNATSFQKGQSGNPSGRPKRDQSTAELLREIGSQPYLATPLTKRARSLTALWEKACLGDLAALAWIVERTEGKVPDVSKANDRLRVEIVYGTEGQDGSGEEPEANSDDEA